MSPVLEQIERALADWLQRTLVPPAPQTGPASPSSADESTSFEPTLVQIEQALKNAGRQSHETDAALEETSAKLSQWRERAAALRPLFPPSPLGGEGAGVRGLEEPDHDQ